MRDRKKEGRERVSIVLLVLGTAMLVTSLAADPTGTGGNPGFGRDQITGAVAGAIVTIVGLITKPKE